jgi:hypothetical protein
MPFLDSELFAKTRRKYDFSQLHFEKQGCYQPWTCFLEASSDLRRRDSERAQSKIAEGESHVFGPGLFSEVGPQQQTGTVPPYSTAHAAYIAARLYQLVGDSLWERRLDVFSLLPAGLHDRDLRVERAHCRDGIVVTASYLSHEVLVHLEGNLAGYHVVVALPRALESGAVRCFIDGQPVPFLPYRLVGRDVHPTAAEIAVDHAATCYQIRLA